MLGVAWPPMRADFDAPLAGLGLLLAASTATYFVTTALTGRLAARTGIRALAVASSIICALGMAFLGAAAAWWHVVVAVAVLGAGSGALDAALNAYVALGRRLSAMGLLHASWAIGAALGPAAVAIALGAASWRAAYTAAALAFLAVSGALGALPPHRLPPRAVATARPRRITAALALGAAALFLYVGLEAAAGQWAFTDLAQQRHLSVGVATTGASLYWFALAAGRLALGIVGERINAAMAIDASVAVTIVAALAFALLPADAAALASLPLMGVALSMFIPLVFHLTPVRFGAESTASAIGYQAAAGTVGGAFVPAAIGLAMQSAAVPVLGWCLAVVAAGLAACQLASSRLTRK